MDISTYFISNISDSIIYDNKNDSADILKKIMAANDDTESMAFNISAQLGYFDPTKTMLAAGNSRLKTLGLQNNATRHSLSSNSDGSTVWAEKEEVILVPYLMKPSENNQCIFEQYRAASCPLDFYQQLLMIFLRIFLPGPRRTFRIQFVPATSWEAEADNTSAVAMLAAGLVNMTTPGYKLDYTRSLTFAMTPTLFNNFYSMLYRQSGGTPERSLSVTELLLRPRGIWVVIFGCFLARFLMKNTNYLMIEKTDSSTILRMPGGERWGIYRKYKILIKIVVGFLLATLSNYVCILFSYPVTQSLPVSNLRELQAAVAAGRFRLLVQSAYVHKMLLSPQFLPNREQYARIIQYNPPMVVKSTILVKRILKAETAATFPRHIFVAITDLETQQLEAELCGLIKVNLFGFFSGKKGILMNRNSFRYARLLTRIGTQKINVFRAQRLRLRAQLVKSSLKKRMNLKCPDSEFRENFMLTLTEISGLLQLSGFLLLIATVLFAVEKLYDATKSIRMMVALARKIYNPEIFA